MFASFQRIASFIVISIGTIYLFTGRGLWKGKNWARIFVLVISWIIAIRSLLSLFTGGTFKEINSGYILLNPLINLIIYGLIIWCMQFRKEVKAYFTKL